MEIWYTGAVTALWISTRVSPSVRSSIWILVTYQELSQEKMIMKMKFFFKTGEELETTANNNKTIPEDPVVTPPPDVFCMPL